MNQLWNKLSKRWKYLIVSVVWLSVMIFYISLPVLPWYYNFPLYVIGYVCGIAFAMIKGGEL